LRISFLCHGFSCKIIPDPPFPVGTKEQENSFSSLKEKLFAKNTHLYTPRPACQTDRRNALSLMAGRAAAGVIGVCFMKKRA
jgi:hypothetical protein